MPSCIKNNSVDAFSRIMTDWIQQQWTRFTIWHLFLLPISWIFGAVVRIRRAFYQKGWLKSHRLRVPVIVVGNINVGGTGKTPLVIWLAEQLLLKGFRPGIISRGYGRSTPGCMEVFVSSSPNQVGDEPILIASKVRCPVFVGTDRVAAGRALLEQYPECDVLISDDGLQYYRMQRDVELVVVDAVRGLGNGALLPAGPLRESKTRLNTIDAIVSNGPVRAGDRFSAAPVVEMSLQPKAFRNVLDDQLRADVSDFLNKNIMAIAGIGNPDRFFQQLRSMKLTFSSTSYPDHHAFKPSDFSRFDGNIILMTEKDAVKCKAFARPNFWALPVGAMINDELLIIILNKLSALRS